MRKAQQVASLLLLVILLMACAPQAAPTPAPAPAPAPAGPAPVAPAKPAWQIEWEKTVEAAQREGTVALVGTIGPEARRAVSEAFKSRFGISSEWLAGAGSELGARVLAERRAGIYSIDTGLIGHSAPYQILKPVDALGRLEPVLFLPELTDPQEIQRVWRFGLEWVDKERTMLAFSPDVATNVAINTQLVKPGEIKGYADLLNPKWKGQIIIFDPMGVGKGGGWVQGIGDSIMGWDYLRKLAEQEPVLTRNARLQIEWLAHGKVAVAIAPREELVKEFADVGAPVQAISPKEGGHLGSGPGVNILLKNRPHPNAAKLFINWLLTKEGQIVFGTALYRHSSRMDVSIEGLDPSTAPDPKQTYVRSYGDEAMAGRDEAMKKSKEIFRKLAMR